MGASYGGFDKPKGDAGALRAIASRVKTAVSAVAGSSGKINGLSSGSTDWQGAGASSFRAQATSLAGIGQKADAAANQFASEVDSYASQLEVLQERWQNDVTTLQGAGTTIDGLYAQVETAVAAQNQKNATAYTKALTAAKSVQPPSAGSPFGSIAAPLPAAPATIPPPTKPNTSPTGIVSGQAVVQIQQWPSTYASVPGLGGLGAAINTVEQEVFRARQDLIHVEADYARLKASAAGRFGGISTSVGAITSAASAINAADSSSSSQYGAFAPRAGDPPVPLSQYAWAKIRFQPGDNLSTIGASFYGNGGGYTGIMKKVLANPSSAPYQGNPNAIGVGQTITLSQTPTVPIPAAKPKAKPASPAPSANTNWSQSPAVGEMRAMKAIEGTTPASQSTPSSPAGPAQSASTAAGGLTAAELKMAGANGWTLGTTHQPNGATLTVTVIHNAQGAPVGLTQELSQPTNTPGQTYSQTQILTFATGQVSVAP